MQPQMNTDKDGRERRERTGLRDDRQRDGKRQEQVKVAGETPALRTPLPPRASGKDKSARGLRCGKTILCLRTCLNSAQEFVGAKDQAER
jgi:hypothetical protein